MIESRHIWERWARVLHRWGLKEELAAILEAAGPLVLLGAPLVYIGQPLFRNFVSVENVDAFVRILENPEDRRVFLTLLKGEAEA